MKELTIDEQASVCGGAFILYGPAWAAVGATVAATDASLNFISGFHQGFEYQRASLRELNGWN